MSHPKVAACLIVKNAAATIEECLAAIRPHVDGVFVYDTGSTDDTVAVLERLNGERRFVDKDGIPHTKPGNVAAPEQVEEWAAKQAAGGATVRWIEREEGTQEIPLAPIIVEQGEWRDDFSWAREQSFAMPGPEYGWLLWLDDDDIILGAQNLRGLAATAHPDLHGYIVHYDYARDENGNCVCQLWRERLIRRRAGYTWRNTVHEVLVPPEGVTPQLAQLDASILRYVHNRPADRSALEPDRNLLILLHEKQQAEDAGEEPPARTLAYLGTEYMAKGEWGEGARYLDEYLQRNDATWADERSQCRHKLAICLRMLGNPHAAVQAEWLAIQERDDWAENLIGLAAGYAAIGEWARCERWARAGHALGMPRSPLILNPVEHTLLPLFLIADACLAQQNLDGARQAIHQAAAIAPSELVQAKLAEIEQASQEAEIVGAILLLRETLVRNDENWKAHQLLQNVPYLIADAPPIVQARLEQREMVKHALQPDEYRRWYRDEPKESSIVDEDIRENRILGLGRAALLLKGLREQEAELGRKPVVLDLGCNDAWLSCWIHQEAGYRVDGVELNRASFEKAKERLARFDAPGKVFHGDLFDAAKLIGGRAVKYDAVAMFEVFEHLPDTDAAFRLLESLVKPGGRVYISTPNGAYDRGQIDDWFRVERKGHLRAVPAHELAEQVLSRGEVNEFDVHAEGRLTFVAYTPQRRKGRAVFFAGPSWEPWSPASVRQGGLGGSETALVQLATRLSRRGYEVKVYSGAEPGLYGGVLYRPFHTWDSQEPCDLFVSSRRPDVFDMPITAKTKALWCHDHSYPGLLTEARAAKIDSVVTLSEWEHDRFARLYPFAEERLTIIRNGISYLEWDGGTRYPDADHSFNDRAPRAVYSSSADRGLDVLLELWPRIREQAPEAELHIFYGWHVFDRVAYANPDLLAMKARILKLAELAGGEDGGIFWRGRVGQVELAEEMSNARVLAYPTAFLETSCITAMEARAAGLPIVTSDLGALSETVGEHGQLLPWAASEEEPHNQTAEYQAAFVSETVALLTDRVYWEHWHRAALDGADELDWEHRVDEWEQLIAEKRSAREKRDKVAA